MMKTSGSEDGPDSLIQCDPYFRQESIFNEVNPETSMQSILRRETSPDNVNVKFVEQSVNGKIKSKYIEDHFLTTRKGTQRNHPLATGYPNLFPVSALSRPKGRERSCEICSLPGRFCCLHCGVSFYCTVGHYKEDSSHPLLCHRLGIIRSNFDYSGSIFDRRQRWSKKVLIMVSLLEEQFCYAIENLYKANLTSAVVEFQTCLTYMPQTWGMVSIEGISLLALMSNAFTQQKNIKLAANSLAQAFFALRELEKVEKGPMNYTRALVFRAQGCLDLEEKRYPDALLHFAEFIYHSTEVFGSRHIRTSAGYYFLGTTFLKMKSTSIAFSVLELCLDICLEYLSDLYLQTSQKQAEAILSLEYEEPIPRFIRLEVMMQLNAMKNIHTMGILISPIKVHMCESILKVFARNYHSAVKEAEYVLELIKSPDYAYASKLKPLAIKLIRKTGKLCMLKSL